MDFLTPSQRSHHMSLIRSCDTVPEMIVRRIVHGMGYRHRLHGRELPGKPDLVFRSRAKVIFVHGCFWHQHRRCADGRMPKSNRVYWVPKLERNAIRDTRVRRRLRRLRWKVLVVWECETADHDRLATRIQRFLNHC